MDTDFETERIEEEAVRAGNALLRLAEGPAQQAADVMSEAFDRAGNRIESALSRAARSGEFSFSAMADAILRDLSRLATERFIQAPIDSLLGQIGSQLPFLGARAEGGPVQSGGAYLVGERGPELFVPGTTGQIGTTNPINISIRFEGSAKPSQLRQTETQIATALARAVRKGAARL
ncbi:phage tail tape measure C-terminal domain-containing protein [Hyphobacterium sp.]|uniref:phage tail tape measure C-terminal domain-containing protein n=1 Tax=Hyphobacterium sp. TaxID=2004662 RepID=UPI003BAC873E